jgi:hypothetical protein
MLRNQTFDVFLQCGDAKKYNVWQDVFQPDKRARSDEDVGMDRFEDVQQVELLVVECLVQAIDEKVANPEATIDITNDVDQLRLGWSCPLEVVFGVEGLDQSQKTREPLEKLPHQRCQNVADLQRLCVPAIDKCNADVA